MRLKNKKLLLSLLLISNWCYGLTSDEINKYAQGLLDHVLQKDPNYNIKFSLNLTEPIVQQFLSKFNPSAEEKKEIIAKAKNIYLGNTTSSTASNENLVDLLIKQRFNLSVEDGERKAHRFLQDNGINSLKDRNEIIKEAIPKASQSKPTPPAPKPGPNVPAQAAATEQQIKDWVNTNGDKIVTQLKAEGFTNSEAITFAIIQAAAKTVKISVVPETAQNSYVLGRLSSKGLPPPPPPPGYKSQTQTNFSSTSSSLPPATGGPTVNPPTSKGVPPPPPPGGSKVTPPTSKGVPPPPPASKPGVISSSKLKLDANGQQVLVDLIKTKFDESAMPSSGTSKGLPPSPKPIVPPLPKQVKGDSAEEWFNKNKANIKQLITNKILSPDDESSDDEESGDDDESSDWFRSYEDFSEYIKNNSSQIRIVIPNDIDRAKLLKKVNDLIKTTYDEIIQNLMAALELAATLKQK